MSTVVQRPRTAAKTHPAATLNRIGAQIERQIRRILRTLGADTTEFERAADSVDRANLFASQEAIAATSDRALNELSDLTSALERLRSDPRSFGRCENCGDLIPAERLELVPAARACLSCTA